MISLHEQWLGYAFRLAAVLAASAGLSPSVAAAVPPVTPMASGSSAAGQSRDAGTVAAARADKVARGSKSGGRGAFVLEDLAGAGAARRSSGGGGPSDGTGPKGANVGIKRLRAALEGALLAASTCTTGSAVPEALGTDSPPVGIPKPVLVGDAEVAAYSPLGISAAVAGRLITAAFLHTVDWHFAAIQGEAVRGDLLLLRIHSSFPLSSPPVLRCPQRLSLEGTVGYVIGVSRPFLHLAAACEATQAATHAPLQGVTPPHWRHVGASIVRQIMCYLLRSSALLPPPLAPCSCTAARSISDSRVAHAGAG